MVNAPKLDVIRSRLDIFQEGCVRWEKLLSSACDYLYIRSGNGWQGTWKHDENLWKQVSGFLISSLSVIEWFWAQKWIECCLKRGWVSTAINSLSQRCIGSVVLTAVKNLFIDCQWSMTWICSLQTVRGGKRWFYIIIGLAITACSCTELIQLSLLLLLLKWGFFKENDSHLRRIKYPGKENVDSDKEKDCWKHHRK